MKCQDIKKLIPGFSEGELQVHEARSVRDHISACSDCRKELELYEKSWDLLATWKDKEPAPGYIGRFWMKMAQEKTWVEKFEEAIKGAFSKSAFVPIFITACVLIIVGSFAYKNYVVSRESEAMLAKLEPEEIELVDQFELAQHYDVIENMDTIEDLDIVENLDTIES